MCKSSTSCNPFVVGSASLRWFWTSTMPVSQKWLQGIGPCVLSLLSLWTTPSHAGDLLLTVWPPPDQLASASRTLLLTAQHHNNFVPPFQAATTSGAQGLAALLWRPHPALCLLAAPAHPFAFPSSPAREEIDRAALHLGAEATLYSTPDWRLGIGWRASMPLSTPGGEGSVTPLARLSWHPPHQPPSASLGLSLGLAILGDPLRPASQDDVPLSWLTASWPLHRREAWIVRGRLGGGWPTARNPARMDAALGLGWQGERGLLLGADLSGGLSPAAAAGGGGLWVGWQAPEP